MKSQARGLNARMNRRAMHYREKELQRFVTEQNNSE